MSSPKLSIAIPVYPMKDKDFFLRRCLDSIRAQTFQDFEIVMTENGKGMAGNTNEAIRQSTGELIKILFMDDYLAHTNALKDIVESFRGEWLVTGCEHDDRKHRRNPHYPYYSPNIIRGVNTIGSPSVLTIKNDKPLLFDEKMTWMLDCDYYARLHERSGSPTILNSINVVIGVGEHQATNIISDTIKESEQRYMLKKHL